MASAGAKTRTPRKMFSPTVQLTRDERAARTREQLLVSAAPVVGEFG